MRHANIAVFVPHNGCPQQCSFCNQKTISGHTAQPSAEDVISACEKAMQGGCDGALVQLGFFGGSFTAIERGYMLSLLNAAERYIKNGFLNGGIRISTRPDFIDEEILSVLKEKGVRAIELGAQSMDDSVLLLNRRGHTAADVEAAARLIKKFGFELGLQMMTGLYGSTARKDKASAERLIALKPETVRVYPTVVLKNTYLAQLFESGEYSPPTIDETVELCAEILPMFESEKIKVIRLGLHAEMQVEESFLAGGYHPALRELVEGEIYYKKFLALLADKPKGQYEIEVPAREISKAVGQKKINISRLLQQGYSCKISGSENTEIRVR